ncbi:hypothetical protein ACTXT7_016832, partial [Hymenolepis weldensis]
LLIKYAELPYLPSSSIRGPPFWTADADLGQPDFRIGSLPYKEKRTLPGTLDDVSKFTCVAARDDAANL